MRKNLFILAAALAVCYSCSNDETVEVNLGNEISFRPLTNSVTRSADITTTNLTDFYVIANIAGTGPFTNYFGVSTPEMYSDANVGGTYTSTNKHYWPSTGKLDFIAFAPATGTDILLTDSTNFSVTPNAKPSAQRDFLYAVVRNQTKAANGTGVVLNFRHALSKVVIQLKNSNTDLHFTVKNVVIGNILPTGAFKPVYKENNVDQIGFSTNGSEISNTTIASETGYYITDRAWTASGSATTYSQTAGTTAYAAFSGTGDVTATALTDDMILIPQALTFAPTYTAQTDNTPAAGNPFNGAYISVELKVQDAQDHYLVGTDNTYVTAMWPLTALTWLPGHKYTYTVDLAGGGYYLTNQDDNADLDPILEGAEIKFVSVTVDNWTDATGIDVTMP